MYYRIVTFFIVQPTLEIFRQYALEYMRFRAAEAVSLFLRHASYPVESFNDSAEYKRVKNISPNAAIWTLKAFELYLHTLSGMEPIIKRGFIYLI